MVSRGDLCYLPAMSKAVCMTCQKPKAALACGVCEESVCKYCAQFLDEERFSFLAKIPKDLSHSVYCNPCFETKVVPEMASYDDAKERAKDIYVFYTTDKKESRLFKRLEEPFKVLNCADREETLLRLAFFTAKANFNAIVDVDITYEKVRNGAYQTMTWNGTGIPTQIRSDKIKKDW
ncbi:hypothetical protein D3C87_89380 [compost metagenome]